MRFLIFNFIFWTLSASVAAPAYHPVYFLDQKVASLIKEIDQRSDKKLPSLTVVELKGQDRNDLLRSVYELGIVEASEFTKALSDKLLVSKIFEYYLKDKADFYQPKAIGLKYFLAKYGLVNSKGQIIAEKEKILNAIETEFPHGAIAKAAVGFNSAGIKNFYFKMPNFVEDLLKESSPIYKPEDFSTPFVSALGTVTSGEFMILQENVITAAGIKKPLVTKDFMEVRLHTFEQSVVPGASYSRWREKNKEATDSLISSTEQFAQEMLSLLPPSLLYQQAWSLDMAVLDNGVHRLIEINTNRGLPGHWSGFLSIPPVLGAYARFFEDHENVKYAGFNGFLFRHGIANIPKYLHKKFIDKSM